VDGVTASTVYLGTPFSLAVSTHTDPPPRHPHSIDALCALPPSLCTTSNSSSTILTGSSDGLVRVVQLFPTKLLGTVADHGEASPIERIAVDRDGEGSWLGSVGHDDVLRLTDLAGALEEKGEDAHEDQSADDRTDEGEDDGGLGGSVVDASVDDEDSDDSSVDERPKKEKKRKRKEKDPLAAEMRKKKKGKREVVIDPSFFSGL